jgi:hypothetical protein
MYDKPMLSLNQVQRAMTAMLEKATQKLRPTASSHHAGKVSVSWVGLRGKTWSLNTVGQRGTKNGSPS